MKKAVYISPSTIPSKSANSIHVINMCHALFCNGYYVNLIFHSQNQGVSKELIELKYGLNLDGINFSPIIYNSQRFVNLVLGIYGFFKALINQYDLVISRNLYASFFLSLLHIPHCYELHSIEINLFRRFMQRHILKKSNNLIVCISYGLLNDLIEDYKPFSKPLVLHDGVTLNMDESIKNYSWKSDKLINYSHFVGYFGQINKGRGIEIIIELAKLNPDVCFVIFGGTLNKDQSFNSYPANVFFMGHVDNYLAKQYMRTFDALLMPYQRNVFVDANVKTDTSRWMSPMKMFEYMSSKVPFISSDIPVLMEVLKDRDNCLIAKHNDANDWNIKLLSLLHNKDLAIKLAEKAFLDVSSEYTWDVRVKKLIGIYNHNG